MKLLANAQNALDSYLGDVVAKMSNGRYFLIEFKRERDGIHHECSDQSGKPHRKKLFDRLQRRSSDPSDPLCKLSRQCHFAGYESEQALEFASYLGAAMFPLLPPGEGWSLNEFHDRLHEKLGSPLQQFLVYLSEMLGDSREAISANATGLVLGYVDKAIVVDGKARPVTLSLLPANFVGLNRMLQTNRAAMDKDLASTIRPSKSGTSLGRGAKV